ncbi:hypothetical protein JN531_004675 [Flagellatimonas centrodinii]|uniref:hypothetical protein n=1 Tax=Flagellatimonas centrodinii TaxID=2806210 RepID=UPI001FEE0A0E|nr:hypothetical protein [Flagellatimonas centrodinii]ULQ47582.1 hypothetical protein JN531_004675 [Flagellatimonas centrodinii]
MSDPLADALRALPDFDPPADGWARVDARLRPRRPARRWVPMLMAAGLGAVAVIIGLQSGVPGPRPAPITVATGANADAGTAPDAWALAAAALALQATSDPYAPTDLDETAVAVTATALLSTPIAEEEWL